MMLRKRVWVVPLLAVCSLALSSCNNRKSGKTVGFAQEGAENDWRKAETASVDSEAQKRGINLRLTSANGDLQKQINDVRSFIAQRVSAIIIAPKVEDGWEPVLREAQDARIPVVLVDRGVSASPELYATLIASDFGDEGRRAADWLAAHSPKDQEVNIVELEGSAGSAPAKDRKRGFDEQIATHANMHIIFSQDGDFTLERGKQVMTNALQSKGKDNIQVVYAHNDNMALGAIQAIEEQGKKPGKDIKVISIDGIHDAIQAVLDGKINCVVECNPLLGPDAFDAVRQIWDGKPPPKRKVEQDALFDQSNVTSQVLSERKY